MNRILTMEELLEEVTGALVSSEIDTIIEVAEKILDEHIEYEGDDFFAVYPEA